MDFLEIVVKEAGTAKKPLVVVSPDYRVRKSKDLMTRGGKFYAIWDEDAQMWSKDILTAQRLIDQELRKVADKQRENGVNPTVLYCESASTGKWQEFLKYISGLPDMFHNLDERITFSNTEVTRESYVSIRLGYPLIDSPCPAFDELISTLYDPGEREKLEWAIGSIIAGDSVRLQKFVVLYGDPGGGKSTILDIIWNMFEPYASTFDAKSLASSRSAFGLEAFRSNPLVSIQHDGDLSTIDDNSKLNSVVSHEKMSINEKFKSAYDNDIKSLLFVGTNKPVRITDAKSGLLRRLIDIKPSGRRLPIDRYFKVLDLIKYEYSGIAWRCYNVYKSLGMHYYADYEAIGMLEQTNSFYNFMEENYTEFAKSSEEGISLKRAWDIYKNYCTESGLDYRLPKHKFRAELANYFGEVVPTKRIGGTQQWNVYQGFKRSKFKTIASEEDLGQQSDEKAAEEEVVTYTEQLELDSTESEIDILYADCPAQYANDKGTPTQKWENVTTKLKELDTTKVHYVFFPDELKNHIVIDLDLKDEEGNKNAQLNLEAAARWPATYAEFSQGGAGLHLHYIYDGDVSTLSAMYAPGIEVKVFNGKSSLRRRLSKCNDLPVAHISSGLPLKEDKKVVSFSRIASENGLRNMIERNLQKEFHGHTKPSVDFIYKILEDAYNGGELVYDVTDMRAKVLQFAMGSHNQRDYCVRLVSKMKWKSEVVGDPEPYEELYGEDAPLVFYDVECFPNVFIVCWKQDGKGHECVRMINPKPADIEKIMKMKLVGFNVRKYDNHMLYGCYLGYNNYELYKLSKRLISNDDGAKFREAYNISYADIYEFSSKRQSLKKFEIELGLHHLENQYDWDSPLPEDKWNEVTDYCCNDVISTEVTFYERYSDFLAHEMLAELTGMTVNANGNTMAARLIFGQNKNPELVYVDLATGKASNPAYQRTDIITAFPSYEYKQDPETKKWVNMYRGVDVGFGGYVYAEPGMYTDVALVDVASMHPHSIIAMNYLGQFTKVFQDLVNTRIHIKRQEYEAIKDLFDGKLTKYLEDETKIGNLAYSLKIVINKIYGLTNAKFNNEFKDSRNVNNIVALRGALFMKTLQDEVQARGFTVAHIKTDSIKIPNATSEIVQFCMEFAKKYGYEFEHEATYDRMCLTNQAVYIAKYATAEKCQELYGYVPGDNKKHPGEWTATGTQFAVPFVFKTLFSHEAIEFKDLCEVKEVQTAMYLDHNEGLPDVTLQEDELVNRGKPENKRKKPNRLFENFSDDELRDQISKGHNYKFVGKIGQFTPVIDGCGGAELLAKRGDSYVSVNGAKGYRWLESEFIKGSKLEEKVDLRYYRGLVDDAIKDISKYGDFEWFANNDDPPSESNHPPDPDDVPWLMPCKDPNKTVCEDCPEYETCPYIHDGEEFSKR